MSPVSGSVAEGVTLIEVSSLPVATTAKAVGASFVPMTVIVSVLGEVSWPSDTVMLTTTARVVPALMSL